MGPWRREGLEAQEAARTNTGKTDPSVSRLERVQNGSEAKLEHGVHGVPVGKGRESGEIRERDGEMERGKRERADGALISGEAGAYRRLG